MNNLISIGLHPIRSSRVCCHLLVEGEQVVLIDTGFIGEVPRIEKCLHDLGLGFQSIAAILLTHGHLDHAANLARLVELTGAPVYAHPDEQAHIDGVYPYRGWSRGCGFLESIGRLGLGYRPAPITHFIQDGDELPFWGGLRVIHLPGHTAGHCGFYSARHDLLFSGDLFASYRFSVHRPPPFLNSCPELFPASMARVRALNPRRILPNHYDRPDGELHRKRFEGLLSAHTT